MHTPGPWTVHHTKLGTILDHTGDTVAIAGGNVDGSPSANARLIAAAPALLEALEELTPADWSLNDPMSLKYGRARDAIEAAK